MSKYLQPKFLASLVLTIIGLLFATKIVGPGTPLYQILGIVGVLLSDLGVQVLVPSAAPPSVPAAPPSA